MEEAADRANLLFPRNAPTVVREAKFIRAHLCRTRLREAGHWPLLGCGQRPSGRAAGIWDRSDKDYGLRPARGVRRHSGDGREQTENR